MKNKKQWAAALLLAGTAIGSGMISLPMVLAKFGIIKSGIIMLFFSILTYLTVLARVDLNLNLYPEATFKDVGNAFGCPWAGRVGGALLKLLIFTLLSAYLYCLGSILCTICNGAISQKTIIAISAIVIALGFMYASKLIVKVSNALFTVMFCVFLALVIELCLETPINYVPEQTHHIAINEWMTVIPVIFTSFGLHTAMQSVTKFCNNDRIMVRNASLIGCLIPAIVYTIWTVAILLVVSNTDAQFFQRMVDGQATDVGELMAVLIKATSSHSVQVIVWIVSTLAILTSVLGVGLALLDMLQQDWNAPKWAIVGVIMTIPAIVSIYVPDAFIRILNFAGSILAVIAIISPVIISWKMQKLGKVKCKLLLGNKWLMLFVFACGVGIIGLGIGDLLK